MSRRSRHAQVPPVQLSEQNSHGFEDLGWKTQARGSVSLRSLKIRGEN